MLLAVAPCEVAYAPSTASRNSACDRVQARRQWDGEMPSVWVELSTLKDTALLVSRGMFAWSDCRGNARHDGSEKRHGITLSIRYRYAVLNSIKIKIITDRHGFAPWLAVAIK